MPDVVLRSDQLTALLSDEYVRSAIARAGKSSATDKRQEFFSVPRSKPLGASSGGGAMHSTVAVALTLAKDTKGTGMRSAPVSPQIATTLLRQARKTSGQSSKNKKYAGDGSKHYEEEDEITPAFKVLRKTD